MNDADLLQCIEIDPGEARASVIWLHGLGADGYDFEGLVPQLGLPRDAGVRFVFPHAPFRSVTINGGQAMRAWYNVRSMTFGQDEDEIGIRESAEQIEALIARENDRGIASEHILLAGFSQGGAIVLHTGLRYAQRLGGILALSTYLPLADTVAQELTDANRATPVMMAHGTEDPVIPVALGERSRQHLQDLGIAVDFHRYPMAHAVCPDEISDIRDWLLQRITG